MVNLVVLFDEIDKIGGFNYYGDFFVVMLEVFDLE